MTISFLRFSTFFLAILPRKNVFLTYFGVSLKLACCCLQLAVHEMCNILFEQHILKGSNVSISLVYSIHNFPVYSIHKIPYNAIRITNYRTGQIFVLLIIFIRLIITDFVNLILLCISDWYPSRFEIMAYRIRK